MTTIIQKLEENATAVLLHIGMWQPRRGKRDDIKKGAEDKQLILDVFVSPEFRRLQALNKKIRRYHLDSTWPWQGDFTLLSNERRPEYLELMTNFMTEYEVATEQFAQLIDTLRPQAQTDVFPTGEHIRIYNQMTVNFVPAALHEDVFRADLNERILKRNLLVLSESSLARLRQTLKWMALRTDPHKAAYFTVYREEPRQLGIRWCQSLIEMGMLSPMHQDVTNQTLAALREMPDHVDFDEQQQMQFHQRIKDLQELIK